MYISDMVLIFIGFLFMLSGLIGSFLPGIPGPPLSFLGILFLHFSSVAQFSYTLLLVFLILTIFSISLDYILPFFGAKTFGGTKYGIIGAAIGLIIGFFLFPPFGIIFGPFIGAFVGELSAGKDFVKSLKSSLGSFLGFFISTITKFVISGIMFFYFIKELLNYHAPMMMHYL